MHLLHVRLSSRQWQYNSERNRPKPYPHGAYTVGGIEGYEQDHKVIETVCQKIRGLQMGYGWWATAVCALSCVHVCGGHPGPGLQLPLWQGAFLWQ